MTPLEAGLTGYALASTLACVLLYREKREATERLYGAWKDGAIIPPPPGASEEQMPPPDAFEGLPSPIMDWLSAYDEDLPAKERFARRARALMVKHKGNMVAVIGELDTPNW